MRHKRRSLVRIDTSSAANIRMDNPTSGTEHLCHCCKAADRTAGPGWESWHCNAYNRRIRRTVTECSRFDNDEYLSRSEMRQLEHDALYVHCDHTGRVHFLSYSQIENSRLLDHLDNGGDLAEYADSQSTIAVRVRRNKRPVDVPPVPPTNPPIQ